MNDDHLEIFYMFIFFALLVVSGIGMWFAINSVEILVIANPGVLYDSSALINTFAETHPYILILLVLYVALSMLIGSFTFVGEFMSMCGSDHPLKNLITWTFFWLPLLFYYLFNFNLRKCCRCKERKKIEVRYKNGQQFCYECWKARFKEPHTCSTCGEKKLLYSFKEDGTKYCKECYEGGTK